MPELTAGQRMANALWRQSQQQWGTGMFPDSGLPFPEHGPERYRVVPVDEPVLIGWQSSVPVIRSACPSCGRIAERRASSWTGHIARMKCDESAEPNCYRVFEVAIPQPQT